MELDELDLMDKLLDAQDSCRGVVHALELMQRDCVDESPLAGVLLRALDDVSDVLDVVADAVKDGSLVVVTSE